MSHPGKVPTNLVPSLPTPICYTQDMVAVIPHSFESEATSPLKVLPGLIRRGGAAIMPANDRGNAQ